MVFLQGDNHGELLLKVEISEPGDQSWLNEGRITLASMLRDNGYNTAFIGKWGLGADWKAAARATRIAISGQEVPLTEIN